MNLGLVFVSNILDTQMGHLYDSLMSRYPTYQHDPLYWESFWVNFWHLLKPKIKLNLGIFDVLVFLVFIWIETKLFSIGSAVAWNKRPGTILLLIVLALVLDALTQLIRIIFSTLWQTFRKERFKGSFKVLMFGVVATALWCLVFWYDSYIRASHLKLSVTGYWWMSNINDYDGTPSKFPAASVFFNDLTLFNPGVPAKPHDWKLIATFSTGEEPLIGLPSDNDADFSDLKLYIGKDSFIWGRPVTQFDFMGGIGNRNTIDAPAEFIFPGVREDTLLATGVTLTVEVKGRDDTAQVIAPDHLREVRPPIL
jgi:hypothetical protein